MHRLTLAALCTRLQAGCLLFACAVLGATLPPLLLLWARHLLLKCSSGCRAAKVREAWALCKLTRLPKGPACSTSQSVPVHPGRSVAPCLTLNIYASPRARSTHTATRLSTSPCCPARGTRAQRQEQQRSPQGLQQQQKQRQLQRRQQQQQQQPTRLLTAAPISSSMGRCGRARGAQCACCQATGLTGTGGSAAQNGAWEQRWACSVLRAPHVAHPPAPACPPLPAPLPGPPTQHSRLPPSALDA